ncbi:SDR family oxidoreductase [Rhodococcus opacus]|uniref:SDR family oxidoreductase n=1 Tax=Rhodococcus opacus TaxID=37919 RepID=UPI00146C83DF|nr:SDR family oxidoreductase [Rhodococcus opacus]MDV7090794.1 SDR family oxidoreductase [Rhodococcus opacus]WKN60212.1 SDR family oxidoreductase [Rhodococcus opacus]
MDLGIAGKRAVIIGGSAGMGLSCATLLASEKVNLVLFARDVARLEEAQRVLSKYEIDIQIVSGDLTKRDDVRVLRDAVTTSGGMDILILNTPRPPSPMRDFLDEDDDARWQEAYHNQLHGALNILREMTPLLLGRGWGRLVAITSASVKQPMPRHALSTIFRAGVQAALKHLVMEVAADGVTVNAVAPATVITPTFSRFHNIDARVASTPLKRAGTLDELSGTVVFLASQQAGYITGQTIQVDGGISMSLL